MSAVVGLAPAASVQAAAPAAAIVATAHPAPYGWQTHVVRSGDTLSDLAIAHRTTVGTLLAHNRLPGGASYLQAGPAPVGAAHRVGGAAGGAGGGAALDVVHGPAR